MGMNTKGYPPIKELLNKLLRSIICASAVLKILIYNPSKLRFLRSGATQIRIARYAYSEVP
jgi:hypothetical protein